MVKKNLLLLSTFVALCSFAADLTFQPIYFSTKSSNLNTASREALGRVAQLLKSNGTAKLSLIGHASIEGEGVDLQKLSEDRANAAKDYLIKNFKIDASRLTTSGKADKDPFRVAKVNIIENRRVEFVFSDEAKAVASENSKNLETINVLYWNTLYHALYPIGTQMGYFEKEGFKLNLIGTNHSIVNQVKAICSVEPFLRAGEMVFSGAVCGGSPHESIAKGVPLVVIGGMLAGGSLLMAKPEMAAKLKASWKNFKGIRIGRPKGTILTSMIIADRLKKEGVDPQKEIVWKDYNSHEEVVDAMVRGDIDAGDTYVPLNLQAQKKHGLVEVYNTVQLFPFHPCCRVITTKAKLAQNREKYVKFLKGIIKSHEYFIKNPKLAMQIVQKNTGYTNEEVSLSLTNPNFILNPDPLKNGFVKFWNMMIDTGYIKSSININDYIDTTVYEDALKSLMKEEPQNDYLKFMMKQFKEQNT